MNAFDTAWNIMKMEANHAKYFSQKELRNIRDLNMSIATIFEPLDPDPSVNFPSQCKECFTTINNIQEGLPGMCSRCIHPHVEDRIFDAQLISGMYGDGTPFKLKDALRQDRTVDPFDGFASGVDFRAFEERMREFE